MTIEGWGITATLEAETTAQQRAFVQALPRGFGRATALTGAPLVHFSVRREGGELLLAEGSRVRFRGASAGGFAQAVADSVETAASNLSSEMAFLHAGVVAYRGRALVFPGRSYAGKSTLVGAWLKRGATYLSDDLAPIDKSLLVHPWPRALGMRYGSTGQQRRVGAREIGGKVARKARPIALIWCATYDPLVSVATLDPKEGRQAFAELLAHCPGARLRPHVVIPALTRLAQSVPVFAGVRGDAEASVQQVLERLRDWAPR